MGLSQAGASRVLLLQLLFVSRLGGLVEGMLSAGPVALRTGKGQELLGAV